jgi:Na+-transporting NADH:ubiquinone oxidoreductase subunit C
MAFNKESNGYTFLFAIVLIIVVGAGLAAISVGLKEKQQANIEIKNKMDILGAIQIENITRKNANELYDKYIMTDECVVLDENGNLIEGVDVTEIDVQKEYKEKEGGKLKPADMSYPLYVADVDGSKKYIMPMVGSGLWGPIWGYVAVNDDYETIFGATFFHKGETPGLGAEISTPIFQDQFAGEKISENGTYAKMLMMKDGSGQSETHKVDGITGGTITSKGVEKMLDLTVQVYVDYFKKLK